VRDGLSSLLNSLWYGGNRLAFVLWPLSWVYRALYAATRLRDEYAKPHEPYDGVPVVVVGNISIGGTGKTPLVIWLSNELLQLGYSVGVISRGYLGSASATPQLVAPDADPALCGDEPVLLAQRTGCPVAVAADRIRAKQFLLAAHQVDVVISDDGLQHHRLSRCCEIAVVDGFRGLGNGLCLPAGPLREPPTRLATVDAVVVNGSGFSYARAIPATAEPRLVERLSDGARRPLDAFAGQRVKAVAGIGNPERFFALLENAGILVEGYPLPDHARISARQLSAAPDTTVMITEKDAVKLRGLLADNVWCVKIDMIIAPVDRERLLSIVVDKIDTCTN
jgi:tetraacyldisaccharide 4'-kinase